MRVFQVGLMVAVVTVVGCAKKPEAAPAAAPPSTAAVGTTAAAMPGMGMNGMAMMPALTAHLDSLAAASPAQMQAMMVGHQALMSQAMDAMGADMMGMSMKPDAAWSALNDSVRIDLGELPGLSGAGLQARMKAHLDRMRRLMAMHQGMMKM